MCDETVCEKKSLLTDLGSGQNEVDSTNLDSGQVEGGCRRALNTLPHSWSPSCRGPYPVQRSTFSIFSQRLFGICIVSIIHLLHLRVRVPLVKVAKVFPPKIYFPLPDFSFCSLPLFLRPILCPNHCSWLGCLQEIGSLRPSHHISNDLK